MLQSVGISDFKVSGDPEDVIITYSLGSCVGLTLYDPVAGVGGMVHCMLPLSRVNPEKAQLNPAMFTDTGVQLLIQSVYDQGAKRDRLIAKVAGGAQLLDHKHIFRIGERNYTVLRKVLWKNNILIKSEEVGGAKSRTMLLYMKDGRTTIKNKGQEVEL